MNSHIANSASTTPLFTTLTVIALTYAQQNRSGRAWIAAGLLYGLALQTHPTVILLAPAFVLWVILNPKNRAPLRTRTPYLTIAAAVLAYSPLLLYNALTWGSSRASLSSVARRTYAFGLPENVGEYGAQVMRTCIDIWRAFAAHFVALVTLTDYLQFVLILYLFLLLASVVLVLRRGNTLPALVFLLMPCCLPSSSGTLFFPMTRAITRLCCRSAMSRLESL